MRGHSYGRTKGDIIIEVHHNGGEMELQKYVASPLFQSGYVEH